MKPEGEVGAPKESVSETPRGGAGRALELVGHAYREVDSVQDLGGRFGYGITAGCLLVGCCSPDHICCSCRVCAGCVESSSDGFVFGGFVGVCRLAGEGKKEEVGGKERKGGGDSRAFADGDGGGGAITTGNVR